MLFTPAVYQFVFEIYMALVTLGIGTSHSPILILDGDRWEQRSLDDRRIKAL